ncbi:MAG TPA: oligosaccharide flippase family protein [Thermohalobaculum sp.]|nr:oligosaccharide flippase family protein [Thermohalobaculum sp.]
MIHQSLFSQWLEARLAKVRRSAFLRSLAGVGGLSAVELVLGLLIAIQLARALGVEGLGVYSLALAVVVIAGIPVELGLLNLVMREIAHDNSDRESGIAKAVLIFAFVTIGMMSVIVIPLTLIFGGALVPALGAADGSILLTAVGLIPLTTLGKTIGAALAGKQRIICGLIPQRLVRPGIFAIALGAVSLLEPGWLTPTRAMALHLAAATVSLAVGGLFFIGSFANDLRRRSAVISWRAWSMATLRLGVSSGIQVGQGQVLLLVAGILSSTADVGLLRIAQRAASLVGLGTSIAYIASAPHIAQLNASGQTDGLQRLLPQIARASSAVAGLALVCIIFGGHVLLDTLFGAGFVAALSTIIILGAAETMRALFGPGTVLMNMVRREGIAAGGFTISLVVGTSIATLLIPTYGADGAAWGSFFGATLMSLFLWYKSRRVLFLDPSVFGWPVHRK